jgi:hypothetical protein
MVQCQSTRRVTCQEEISRPTARIKDKNSLKDDKLDSFRSSATARRREEGRKEGRKGEEG